MYFFDRKTMYLVWKQEDGQARGVGSVRFMAMEDICRVEVIVTSCGKIHGNYPVYLLSGHVKTLVGHIELNRGRGNLSLRCQTDKIGHKYIAYQYITGIWINLNSNGCLEQRWLPMHGKQAEVSGEVDTSMETECLDEKPMEEKLEEVEKDSGLQLFADKWQQLCVVYPVVHPFEDTRSYLSIEPRDFVVLSEKHQAMVQNSFLLHSFYQYKHILLGRSFRGGRMQYYLGIPGLYYEKERSAAIYYGFESFEAKKEPVPEGGFGYYMKRVEI